MNRRTFIKGSIGLSIIGIAGCTDTDVRNNSNHTAIEKITTDTQAKSLTQDQTVVTVQFKDTQSGILTILAYEDNEIVNSESINVIEKSIVSYTFDNYYEEVSVKFDKE